MRSTPDRPSPRPRRRSILFRKAARNTAWTACSGCMMPLPSEWISSLTRRFWNTALRKTAKGSNNLAANIFLHFKEVLKDFDLARTVGTSKVVMEPAGVVGIFSPWNSSAGSIAIKVAPAIAAGCTVVIKPSEMSAMQTEVLMDAFHEARLPPRVIHFVTGLGEVVGTELTQSPDIQKIAFTGSTQIGKLVAKNSLDTMKRLTLELGGKSPNIILDDADFSTAIPMAINACYLNNGQACIAASRLIVPEDRLDEVKRLTKAAVEK